MIRDSVTGFEYKIPDAYLDVNSYHIIEDIIMIASQHMFLGDYSRFLSQLDRDTSFIFKIEVDE